MRRISDFGFNPKWVKYPGGWEYDEFSIKDIAMIQLDLKTHTGKAWYVAEYDDAIYYFGAINVTLAKNPVAVQNLVIKDNRFSGNIVYGKKRAEVKGEVLPSKNMHFEYRISNADSPQWRSLYMSPGEPTTDKINTNVKVGDRCRMRVRFSSVGLFKVVGWNGVTVQIDDLTQAWRIVYRGTGPSVAASFDASVIDFGEWSDWVDVYPKHSPPNMWDGMWLTTAAVGSHGEVICITDDQNRNVVEVPQESWSVVNLASYGKLKLTRDGEYSLK
ncbi:MAG: hypothetical protein AAGD13_09725 [Pseudomonadota bacterium]